MPSPFPGMDPYLEQPAIFPGFHDRFITYLSEALQPLLPAPYYADIGDRDWVEVSERRIGPDVKVLHREESEESKAPAPGSSEGTVATAVRAEPVVVTVPHDELRETFLAIYAQIEGERLVTAIELLSLANKTPGAHGRDLFLRKQDEILRSQTHLVEVDLLRGGQHATAVRLGRARKEAGAFEYHVCVHCFDKLEDFLVYPIRLKNQLPIVGVPLLPGDGEVNVDLQSVFDRCYDAGPYRRRIDYNVQPEPPLTQSQWKWMKAILSQKS